MPLVLKLKSFYDFSLKLESIVPKILHELCLSPRPGQPIAGYIPDRLLDLTIFLTLTRFECKLGSRYRTEHWPDNDTPVGRTRYQAARGSRYLVGSDNETLVYWGLVFL